MSVTTPFWTEAANASGGLNTIDRMNEILFGLIMVLTFTCSISAATEGREEISTILWSALSCNVAWGLVDSLMYLFAVLLERGETFTNVRAIRNAKSDEELDQIVKDSLPPLLGRILKKDHIHHIASEIRNFPEPPSRVFFTWHDLGQAVAIFFIVFLSTFPVSLPFLAFDNVHLAMRISNGTALLLLFITGVYLAKKTGRRKILSGLIFAAIGSVLVAVTIALGG